ncbi:MAG TPA: Gfo/Idh/MocA family oxidoreductase [Polyangiaceae bacterium]|nr:Gfo/Idh/MocA family oxidoreductase [Polyangiaceae bacterium]
MDRVKTDPMQRKLKVGLVGFGRWGRKLAHGLLNSPQVELLGVCDRAFNAGQTLPLCGAELVATCNELGALLQHSKIEALVVATPADSHAELSRAALQAGLHVFVEKPLALNVEDANDLLRCARSVRRIMMVGHILHHDPAVIAARRWIQDGADRDISLCLSERINVGHIHPLTAWWDLAPHDLSLFLSLLGASSRRIAIAANHGVLDATIGFQCGTGRLRVGFGPERIRRMAWIGGGSALLLNDAPGRPRLAQAVLNPGAALRFVAKHRDFSMTELWRRLDEVTESACEIAVPSADALNAQFAHFAHCALRGQRPTSDGAEGAAVVELLAAGEALLQPRSVEKPRNALHSQPVLVQT